MKKIFLFLGAMLSFMLASAEVVKLDLTTATNLNGDAIAYEANHTTVSYYNDLQNVMDSTYSVNPAFSNIMANEGTFLFDHLPTGESYGGTSWEGFTVSKMAVDSANQFACVAKGGVAGEGTPFLVGYYSEYAAWALLDYSPCHVTFAGEYYPVSVQICQNSLTMINLKNGLGAARAFTAEDELTLKIYAVDEEGYNDDDKEPVVYKLAAGTNFNDGWVKIDLRPLGKTIGLNFEMTTTDQSYGFANTALYFAMDELVVNTKNPAGATFENEEGGINVAKADTCWQGADAPAMGWNNWKSDEYTFQTYSDGSGYYYSAFTVTNETANTSTGYLEPYRSASGGAYEGENFAVWNMNYYGADTVSFAAQVVPGFFVNNTAYAVTSMLNGDAYAKRFEKDDWLKLTITGLKDKAAGQSVDFYLAKDGKYVNQWTYVDLSELGEIDGVVFSMSSSDSGEWGMNTPAYFAMDNFGAELPEGYIEPARAEFPVVVEITIAKEVRFTDAVKEEGWWQIIAQDDKYTVYICTKEGSVTEIAGTYTVDDLDEDYSGLEIEGVEDGVFFTEGSVTVTVDAETGDITVVGTLTGSDGVIYDLTLAYSDPKPEGTVDVKITDGALDDEYVDLGVYIVVGTDENGVTVQLALWLEEGAPFTGDYTEEDLDNLFFGSFVGVNEIEYEIFSATIKVVPGNKEGEYKLTADLLCYNNTLYKVEMLIPAKESGLSDINAATTVQKFIRDGQVLILRDGKTVNMHGVEVR